MMLTKTLLLCVFFLQPWLFSGLVRFELLVIGLAILLVILRGTIRIPINEIIFLLLSLSFVLVCTSLHGEFDISLIKRFITISLLVLGSYLVVNVFNVNKSDVINALAWVVVISLAFYLMCLAFPSLKIISLQLKGETYGIEERLEVYRLWFPTSAHTFLLGLFFFTTTVLFLQEKKSFLLVLVSIICASISARSAMLLSIVYLVYFIVSSDKRYLVLLIAIVPIFYFTLNVLADRSDQVKYALEPIENFIETGSITSSSSDDLINKHLYVPSEETILFGDGRYTDIDTGKFYGSTDSGVLRPTLYGGLLFLVFYFVFLLRYLSVFKTYGIHGYAFIFMILVANIKAEVLGMTPYFSVVLVLYFVNKRDLKSNLVVARNE